MAKEELSPRETEIVELSAEGLTNEAIADRLGLSMGTVNTYWLRIKLKTGGLGRTDTVVRIFDKRFKTALEEERVDWEGLAAILLKRGDLDVVAEKARGVELRTRLAMLHLAMDHVVLSTWATDKNLRVDLLTNSELPSSRSGSRWADGQTLYELFSTTDHAHPAIAAHLEALAGSPSRRELSGEFAGLILKVVPVLDEDEEVVGCISILKSSTV